MIDGGGLARAVSTGDPICVKFHRPWCPHCKRLEPVWNQFANMYPIRCKTRAISIDLDQHEQSVLQDCGDIQVIDTNRPKHLRDVLRMGVPTIIKFQGGGPGEVYTGDRSVGDLVKWCNQETGLRGGGPPPIKLNAVALREMIEARVPAMVNFHRPGCPPCERLVPEFQDLAAMMAGGGVRVTRVNMANHGPQVASVVLPGLGVVEQVVRGTPTLVMLNGAGEAMPYEGPRTARDMAEALQSFVGGGGATSPVSAGGDNKDDIGNFKDQIEKTEAKVKELTTKKNALKSDLEQLQNDIERFEGDKKNCSARLQETERTMANAKKAFDAAQERLRSVTASIQQAKVTLDSKQREFKQMEVTLKTHQEVQTQLKAAQTKISDTLHNIESKGLQGGGWLRRLMGGDTRKDSLDVMQDQLDRWAEALPALRSRGKDGLDKVQEALRHAQGQVDRCRSSGKEPELVEMLKKLNTTLMEAFVAEAKTEPEAETEATEAKATTEANTETPQVQVNDST